MGTKLFSDLITFTRASSATQVNSSGLVEAVASNQPRFDYDPVTLQPKGLLIEEQRTNLLTYSEQFDNAAWLKTSATVTANVVVAPDGKTTAGKEIPANGVAGTYLAQGFSATSGVTYTYTVYAKAAEFSELRLLGEAGAFGSNQTGIYNLITGGASIGAGSPTVSMASVGNGWWRCVLTATATVTTTGVVQQRIATPGDGTSGIYIWGAQIEAGAFPTSYIPTTTAAATRATDVATITGSNFSSWYRQGEGTLLGEVISSNGTVCLGVGNTFSDTMYATRGAANNISFRSGGADQAVLSAPFNAASGYANKVVFAYRVNDFAAVSNGGVVSTDTSGAVSSNMVRLNLGSSAWDTSGGNSINGHIRRITYYPRRLTDAELQALTK